MSKYDVQSGAKAITNAIAKVGRNVDTLNTNVQAALVLIVQHGHECGDVSGLGRLLNRMRRSKAATGRIARFVATHTSIGTGPDRNNAGMVKSFLRKGENGEREQITAEMVDAIRSNNWFDFEVEPVEAVFTAEDVEKRVGNTIAFLDRLLKGEAKGKTLAKEDTSRVQTMRNRLQAAIRPTESNVATVG